MTFVRGAIDRMEGLARHGFPKPPSILPSIHHAFAKLGSGVDEAEELEELIPFLRRCQSLEISSLKRGALNRLLRGVWCDPEFEELGKAAVERAVSDDKSSTTKALIDGYLLYFPADRDVIVFLSAACRSLAEKREGHWQVRSNAFRLFDPGEGPSIVGQFLADCDGDASIGVFAKAGLGLSPFATNFGHASFTAACRKVAAKQGEAAIGGQTHLLDLLEREEQFDDSPNIVRALLEPWIDDTPPTEHRQRITAFLLDRISDPRIYPRKQRWDPIRAHLTDDVGTERADQIIQVLRRWLTEVAMRTFFRAIAETTDRLDQWKQRESFWLAYLDAGHVNDAWPALGARAQTEIRAAARAQGERLDHGVMQNGPAGSSSLIIEIGDLRISEWSDNGMCRFWHRDDPKAPKLYDKRYDNGALRTTEGRSDFVALRHDAGGAWTYRFASLIYRRTGIPHPRFGQGYG